jgi:hypothetical protein
MEERRRHLPGPYTISSSAVGHLNSWTLLLVFLHTYTTVHSTCPTPYSLIRDDDADLPRDVPSFRREFPLCILTVCCMRRVILDDLEVPTSVQWLRLRCMTSAASLRDYNKQFRLVEAAPTPIRGNITVSSVRRRTFSKGGH